VAKYIQLMPGDPAPWFKARSSSNPRYSFDTIGGRYVVMGFFGSISDPLTVTAFESIIAQKPLFDDRHCCYFGVSHDPADEKNNRFVYQVPGLRQFWDFDGAIGKAYGSLPHDFEVGQPPQNWRRFWLVLDPTLRVLQRFDFTDTDCRAKDVFTFVKNLSEPTHFAGVELQAPVLVLPNVFEPELCAEFIQAYETHGGEASGFMRQIDGKTHLIQDASHKVRKDVTIEDPAMRDKALARVVRRIVPEIQKIHQFTATRMERYIVSCYAADDGGHFGRHRDNTTSATAHRRFAVSINLNADFDGGEVFFPEYGSRSFKPPPGGAVIFSCSLLHAVTKVTRGKRYAFLPFLYDDAAAHIREANNVHLADSVAPYMPED
jgi:predicted 2-oxoglutarate/Fe(II)-dependent dioxygenase YbiX/peroxiredoxin